LLHCNTKSADCVLGADAGHGGGGSQAQDQQQRRGKTVEEAFEDREGHDTQTFEVNLRGSGGVCYLNGAKIGAI
jgi:hypothetical protein